MRKMANGHAKGQVVKKEGVSSGRGGLKERSKSRMRVRPSNCQEGFPSKGGVLHEGGSRGKHDEAVKKGNKMQRNGTGGISPRGPPSR